MASSSPSLNEPKFPSRSNTGVLTFDDPPHDDSKWPSKSRNSLADAPELLRSCGRLEIGAAAGPLAISVATGIASKPCPVQIGQLQRKPCAVFHSAEFTVISSRASS